jgi:hypothetical protein
VRPAERVLLVIEADVRARLAQDPWSPGLRQVGSVEHWEILLASVS